MSIAARERVLAALAELNADELEVLAEVAAGLQRGRQVYGPLHLATDHRDMRREALEEVRDALVYTAAALVRAQHASSHAQPAQEPRSAIGPGSTSTADSHAPGGAPGMRDARGAGGAARPRRRVTGRSAPPNHGSPPPSGVGA